MVTYSILTVDCTIQCKWHQCNCSALHSALQEYKPRASMFSIPETNEEPQNFSFVTTGLQMNIIKHALSYHSKPWCQLFILQIHYTCNTNFIENNVKKLYFGCNFLFICPQISKSFDFIVTIQQCSLSNVK